MDLPLSGVRVIAFEQYGAGPFGTQYLADLGAEVIKVEPAGTSGDYLRAIGPYFIDGEDRNSASSIFFQALNRNKKSITLDIMSNDGKIILQKKVKISKKETKSSLAKKILVQEHKLYPKAILKVFNL